MHAPCSYRCLEINKYKMDWFFFLYMVVFQIRCGYNELVISKNISGDQGNLTSPDFPGNYPINVNYTWILNTGHEKATVYFEFDVFDIFENPYYSCDDFLSFMLSDKKGTIIDKITEMDPCCFTIMHRCGRFSPFHMIAKGRLIRINFVSDDRRTAKGFSFTWKVSRPVAIKTTTQVTISITKTQKPTTRTTKPPKQTTLTSRKTTKSTTGTTTSETITTKMQRKSTMKTTAENSTVKFYKTEEATTGVDDKSTILKETTHITTSEFSKINTQQPTVGSIPNPTTKGENFTTDQIVYLAIGIGVIEVTLVTVGICIVKHRRNSSAKNSRARRDKQAKNRHVARKTVVSVNNVYDCIPLEHFQDEDTIQEEGMYVDLPQNVYDEAFVKRPHVNEKDNVYQGYNN